MSTLISLLPIAKARASEQIAFKVKKDRRWKNISWLKHVESIEYLAVALRALGIKKGDRICIFSQTRYEWTVADMAIMSLGAISVPIYPNSSQSDVNYIINNCQANTLFIESEFLLPKLDNHPQLENIITFSAKEVSKNQSQKKRAIPLRSTFFLFEELLHRGQNSLSIHSNLFSHLSQNVFSKDIASIIYTSGSTGIPKGVSLSHEQAISSVVELLDPSVLRITKSDCSLCFLPLAHVLGRFESWGGLFAGYTIAFAESVDKLEQNLREVQPTVLVAVPRIFEKIYTEAVVQLELSGHLKKVLQWALQVKEKVSSFKQNKMAVPFKWAIQFVLAKKIFDHMKNKMGGRLRLAFCGGAPLDTDILNFFHASGLLILEGYGLTETTGPICVNRPQEYEFGTVGKPFGDVQIKLDTDGEIFVKSKKVMVEYYQNKEANQKAFTDGYLATGDIGTWTPSGNLKITDRKKELIKLSSGKYIAPQKLESLLCKSPYISHPLIYGDRKKYVVALITLNSKSIEDFAKNNNIKYQHLSELIQSQEVQNLIFKVIQETNDSLANHETIKNFIILDEIFSTKSGELTANQKVRRTVCIEKYQNALEGLY